MQTRALLAELIGTFALVFTVFLTVHNMAGNPAGLIAIALAVGLVIVTFGTAFGSISGGHFNPCVTFGMMVAGKLSWAAGIAYWIAQCIGGIAAVYTASFVLSPNGAAAMSAISLSRGESIELVGALVAEAIAAFFFVTVILMTAVHKKAPTMGALFLGLVLTFCILAIGPISGGAINPAVGLALSVGSAKWDNVLSWTVGPMLGAAAAAMLYLAVWDKDAPLAEAGG